jgi:hypothetical protein
MSPPPCQVDDLERLLHAWSTGVDATFLLPSVRTLTLTRRAGRVHGILTLAHEPDAITLDFRLPTHAVVVTPS